MPEPTAADLRVAFRLPPRDAVRFFEAKGYRITWDWREMEGEAHAKAFTVARASRLDILQDIRGAVDTALKEGRTERWFVDTLKPVLQAKGWWGREIEPETGEIPHPGPTGRAPMLGSPHRLRTIYRTNLQSAYMAGRWKAMDAARATHPYLQYVAVLDSRTRPGHRAMHGKVFRADDPIWHTHSPPLGFNCRCRLRPLTARAVEREGLAPSSSEGHLTEVERPMSARDPNGPQTIVTAYKGPGMQRAVAPDPGWNYNVGEAWTKPFTPPPLDTLPRTFPEGVPLPDLPAPAKIEASRLLPEGRAPEEYARAFLAEFGASEQKPLVYRDVAGDPVVIDDALFRDGAGNWKAAKGGRGPYMRLLADAVRVPDEIWLRWEESRDAPGKWLLKRRYIKTFEIDDGAGTDTQYGLAVFEIGKDGWTGSTAMIAKPDRSPAARARYIAQQRDGFLRYRK